MGDKFKTHAFIFSTRLKSGRSFREQYGGLSVTENTVIRGRSLRNGVGGGGYVKNGKSGNGSIWNGGKGGGSLRNGVRGGGSLRNGSSGSVSRITDNRYSEGSNLL